MIVLGTSVAGAPGVTTTLLSMALQWPGASMLVDTDVQQAVLAGYFAGQEPPTPSMEQLALAATRTNGSLADIVVRFAHRFPSDQEPNRRLFLPGPMTPWSRGQIEQRWSSVAPALAELRTAGIDVLLDYGRLPLPPSRAAVLIPPALLDKTDAIIVMMEPTLQHIAASQHMVTGLALQVQESVRQPLLGIVLRQPAAAPKRLGHSAVTARTYTDREISKLLQVPVLGHIPHDTASALSLHQGLAWPSHSPLAKAATSLARDLQQRSQAAHQPMSPEEIR